MPQSSRSIAALFAALSVVGACGEVVDPAAIDAASGTTDATERPIDAPALVDAPNPVDAIDAPQAFSCNGIRTASALGFTRQLQATHIGDTSPRDYTQVRTVFGNDYPATGAVKPIGVYGGRYVSLAFTTPATRTWYSARGLFTGVEAQGGVFQIGFQDAYFLISKCEGDFVIDPRPARSDDPASNLGCRSYRGGTSGSTSASLYFRGFTLDDDDMSSDTVCDLEPNTTYYLNMIIANPAGGITFAERGCLDTTSPCGFQMQFQ